MFWYISNTNNTKHIYKLILFGFIGTISKYRNISNEITLILMQTNKTENNPIMNYIQCFRMSKNY